MLAIAKILHVDTKKNITKQYVQYQIYLIEMIRIGLLSVYSYFISFSNISLAK